MDSGSDTGTQSLINDFYKSLVSNNDIGAEQRLSGELQPESRVTLELLERIAQLKDGIRLLHEQFSFREVVEKTETQRSSRVSKSNSKNAFVF